MCGERNKRCPAALSKDKQQKLHAALEPLFEGDCIAQAEQVERIEHLEHLSAEYGASTVIEHVMRHQMSFSGPLPHPALLKQYPPGIVDVIVGLAQKDQAHLHDMQKNGMQADIERDKRAQKYAFAIATLVLLVAAIVTPYSTRVAAVIAGIDVIGLAAVFLGGRYLEHRLRRQARDEPTT